MIPALAAGVVAGTGGAPSPAFSYDDIPGQLLRINSLEGSLAFSGGTLTGVTDVSGAEETITVTGTPTYTASDADLNGAPSFELVASSGITAANVDRASIVFTAVVAFMPSASLFFWDADESSNRHYGRMSASAFVLSGSAQGIVGEPVAGRKRILAPNDAAAAGLFNGVAMAAIPAGSAAGNGIILGQNYVGSGYGGRLAFFMQCSVVPGAPLLAALEAKLIEDFG